MNVAYRNAKNLDSIQIDKLRWQSCAPFARGNGKNAVTMIPEGLEQISIDSLTLEILYSTEADKQYVQIRPLFLQLTTCL